MRVGRGRIPGFGGPGFDRYDSATGGFDGLGGIGGIPSDIGCGAVSRRYCFVEQTEIDRELGAVVRGVQHTAPEDPDALAVDVEERDDFEPPAFGLQSEEVEALSRQFEESRFRCR